jgi:hypothetical protein
MPSDSEAERQFKACKQAFLAGLPCWMRNGRIVTPDNLRKSLAATDVGAELYKALMAKKKEAAIAQMKAYKILASKGGKAMRSLRSLSPAERALVSADEKSKASADLAAGKLAKALGAKIGGRLYATAEAVPKAVGAAGVVIDFAAEVGLEHKGVGRAASDAAVNTAFTLIAIAGAEACPESMGVGCAVAAVALSVKYGPAVADYAYNNVTKPIGNAIGSGIYDVYHALSSNDSTTRVAPGPPRGSGDGGGPSEV